MISQNQIETADSKRDLVSCNFYHVDNIISYFSNIDIPPSTIVSMFIFRSLNTKLFCIQLSRWESREQKARQHEDKWNTNRKKNQTEWAHLE